MTVKVIYKIFAAVQYKGSMQCIQVIVSNYSKTIDLVKFRPEIKNLTRGVLPITHRSVLKSKFK